MRFWIFDASQYDPARLCNLLWMHASTVEWAVRKILALGDGRAFVIIDSETGERVQ